MKTVLVVLNIALFTASIFCFVRLIALGPFDIAGSTSVVYWLGMGKDLSISLAQLQSV